MSGTVDASVWVAAELTGEPGADAARRVVRELVESGTLLHQPVLTLVEVASALTRRGLEADLVGSGVARLAGVPGATFHDVDADTAMLAARVAIRTGLRSADAIYLATALASGSFLITLDQEVRAKAPPDVPVVTPEEWLAARP